MAEMDLVHADAVSSTLANSKNKRLRKNLPDRCFACGTPVQGPFCHECGQKNDDCRRSIVRLGVESFGEMVTYDGRVLRTLRSVLTRPGKHVRDYGDGKRSPYSPPVRFFLVISFIFFTALWYTDTHLVTFKPQVTVDEAGENQLSFEGGFLKSPDKDPYTEEERQAFRDMVDMEDAEINFNGKQFTGEEAFNRMLSVVENPTAFNTALNDWIPRIMIVMIPLLSLLGALFIRGKDALIYDHLLVSLTTHTIAFLVLTLGLLGSGWLPGATFAWLFFAGVPIYYILSLKGAFKRGWFKTLISCFFIFGVYSLFLTIALTIALVASFTAAV